MRKHPLRTGKPRARVEPTFGRGGKPGRAPSVRKPAAARTKRVPKRLFAGRRWLPGRGVWRIAALMAVWAFVALIGTVAWFAWDLPDVDNAATLDRKPSMTLLAADGKFLSSVGEIYGAPVQIAELPRWLPQAVIATEDRRFHSHHGVDLEGLARAAFVNISSGELRQGGSTITQQLAKNLFLTPERTIGRKIREVLLALWLEHRFSKDEILALYLNRVYFGAGTYGVDAAARRYFGKSAKDVNVWESALLAGLLRAPSRLALTNNPEQAGERARLVLSLMVETGAIDQRTADQAAQSKVPRPPEGGSGIGGRYFGDWVFDQVQGHIGYVDRDLTVTTTLDPRLQEAAHMAVQAALGAAGKPGLPEQAAVVAMTPTGAVRALVGGKDYGQSQFNRATQAKRQPGSAFKMFVYLAALESGLLPDDRFVDAPISIGAWAPDNFNDRYYGDVTMREAVARSLNSVAVQAAERVGPKRVATVAQRLGVSSELRPELSLALGTSEVNLLELTGAFATLANSGNGVWPHGITEIRDRTGAVLYKRSASGATPLIEPGMVAGMHDLLGAVIEWGTGKSAALGRPAAGKTGTSQDHRDAWFVGYTADLVTGVWMGNDDNSPMKNVTGGSIPARLWRDVMVKAHAGLPPRPLPLAGTIRLARDDAGYVDPVTGKPAQPRAAERSFLPRSWFGGGSSRQSSGSPGREREGFEKMGN